MKPPTTMFHSISEAIDGIANFRLPGGLGSTALAEDIRVLVRSAAVDAYKRGAEWQSENSDMSEYLEKAAHDYADKLLAPKCER